MVDGGADGAGFEDGAVDGFDGGRDPLGEGLVFGVVGREHGAGVAVCWWEKEGYQLVLIMQVGSEERERRKRGREKGSMGKRGLTSHEELRVRMIINEQFQLLSRCRQFVHETGEDDRFRRIGRCETYTVQYHPSASPFNLHRPRLPRGVYL